MEREYFGEHGIIFMPHSAVPEQIIEATPEQTQDDFVNECFTWGPFRHMFPDVETEEDVRALLNEEGAIVYADEAAKPPKPNLWQPGDV